jgi:hypothetical protein
MTTVYHLTLSVTTHLTSLSIDVITAEVRVGCFANSPHANSENIGFRFKRSKDCIVFTISVTLSP